MWRYIVCFTVLLLAPCAFGATRKNVLILHEGSRLLAYQFVLSSEIERDLGRTPFDVQIFDEYLDTWRLSHDPSDSIGALQAKYAGIRFDVVIVDGNAPFQVLLKRPPAFLRGTPVVFLTVPDYDVPAVLPPNITGVAAHKEYGETIRLAMKLQPGLKHVFLVESGLAPNPLRDAAVHNELAAFRNQLEIVDLTDVTLEDLLKTVQSAPPDSAILFDTYLKDPAGKSYVPTEVSELIARNANAPVYALFKTVMGTGPLAGIVISFETAGEQGARMVRGLLAGAPVSQYPVEYSRNDIVVDWGRFQGFGLAEKNLPSSAIVLFRPPTLWEKYWGYLVAGGVVILFQGILIIELALAGKLRKRSERAARELASRLINAQEEERRRIAGELHDDVSQRLALVAVHLDIMRQSPPVSRENLIRELTVLYGETDLISSDIHQFSHELHPAVLERLGLAAALRRYCSEFSEHRKVAVHMKVTGEEPALSPETALAFFRIGQECLTNAVKHGGATGCEVSLTYARNRITLAVKDNGSGFDSERANAQSGLGIQSMRERLRPIDGRLRIRSSALEGTTVLAEARLVPASCAPEVQMAETSGAESVTSVT